MKEVSTFKFLGITVDQNLTWKNHVDDLAKKCSRSIGILHKVKQFLPESALLSLFLSHINYGITACSANSVDKDRLHVLQKRALRAVNNSEYRSHSNPLALLNIINLKYLTYVIITLVYSCINIVITCYHPHLIICQKLMLKTIYNTRCIQF